MATSIWQIPAGGMRVLAEGPRAGHKPHGLSGFPGEVGVLAGARILQIIPELEAGGAERTTVDVAGALAAVGARALVATEGGRLIGELQAKGGHWLRFPAAAKNPAVMAVNVLRLMMLCRREGVQIIHARSRAPAWVALGAARRLGLPFVTTYHGSYSGRTSVKVLYNSVMARGDVVIANSRYTADLIRRMHPEQAGDRVRVIHRGTDLAVFNPVAVGAGRVEALRRAWKVAPHERVILLAARLTAWKGHRVLIEAAAQMRDQGIRDVAIVLAGDAQGRAAYERELDALIAARNLGAVVRRVGHCTDMPAAFRAASVVAVPSIEPEAFGRSAVEAQALGTPVVVSDLGAVPETVLAAPDVPPGLRTGWRVPPGDVPALAAALTEALALGASARDAMARRARTHVEAHFSLDRMAGDTLAVYAGLLGGTR
ncbi:MAG: glycosyltransferase family 4 protein [Parafilimonas terrae]|nr:glycosyltransferase family 4 protein [Parafilimonas terrae]